MIVNIQGYGSFDIPAEKGSQLIEWLTANQAAKITENVAGSREKDYNNKFTGRELLNG